MSNKKSLIIIVGPTGAGKTELAIKIAKKFNGEIVNADPWQMYRNLDIGTAKPQFKKSGRIPKRSSKKTVQGVAHHLFDIANPKYVVSVKEWKEKAMATINDIHQREKLPIVVGGTWLYIKALRENLAIPEVPPDPKLRKKLEKEFKLYGTRRLYLRILKKDPQAASFLDPHNPRRLIRAWEVIATTGRPFSQARKRGKKLPWRILTLGLVPNEKRLFQLLQKRIAKQIRQGLKTEVKTLARNFGWKTPALQAIGYREWQDYFKKKKGLTEIKNEILLHTWQLARKQLRIFKKMPKIHWIKNQTEAFKLVSHFLDF